MKLIFGFISTIFIAFNLYASDKNYTIIVDAGSSGSRLHLYSYENNDIKTINEECFFKIKPGLSSYANNPLNATNAMDELLGKFKECTKKEKIDTANKIDLYLFATAGMRLVDEETSKQIYSSVKESLAKEPLVDVKAVETISGIKEGLYDWIAVNALKNTFGKCSNISYGAIDIGGTSAQIAYVAKNKADATLIQNISGCSYPLYIDSYLGLGRNQARKTINKTDKSNSCYASGYLDANISGSYNYKLCNSAYKELVSSFGIPSKLKKAAQNKGFVAMDTAVMVGNFLKLDGKLSQQNMDSSINSICALPYSELKNRYQKFTDIETLCGASILTKTLLFDKSGFNFKNKQISATDEIDDKEVEWSLGALIYLLEIKSSK